VIPLQHPGWASSLTLALVVLLLALLLAAARAGRRRRTLLGEGPLLPGIGRDLVQLAALAAIGAALLGPRIGERTERVDAAGVDVVLLLDVSRSMDARDVAPSRLDRARRDAELVLASLESGDRAALAAFGGRGVLLTPLTPDRAALLDVLPSVDAELMRARGSDLGGGVRAALGAYEPASLRPRVLLVLSDGEDAAKPGDEAEASAEAARGGVRILAAGIGSEVGGVVPDHGVALRDASGDPVRSRRDLERLGALAAGTGGRLLATDAFGAIDVADAVREIRRDAARAPGESVERRVAAVQVAPFAALAFVLLALELAGPFPLGRRATRRRLAVSGACLVLVVAAALPPLRARAEPMARGTAEVAALEAEAARAPRDARTLVRLGAARARAGLGPEAKRAFLAAALYARDPGLAANAYFDLGVAALESGELEAARDAFFDALALAPSDDEARFNLEWTLRALREVPPPPPPSGGEGATPGTGPQEGGDADGDPGVPGAPDGGASEAPGNPAGTSPTSPTEAAAGQGRPKGEPGARAQANAGSGESGGEASGARAPALDAAQTARWLRAVQDDPGRSLRDAARAAGGAERPLPQAPAW
jgi:Ca-activated chloride channel family protein